MTAIITRLAKNAELIALDSITAYPPVISEKFIHFSQKGM